MASYQVLNHRTGAVVGVYASIARARMARDRADLQHGAAVHSVRAISAQTHHLGAGISHADRAGML